MACWRNEALKEWDTHCQEMEARTVELEGGGTQCFCLGVIDFAHRDSEEHSKRVCIVDNTKGGLNISLDLTDVDVASLQATLSGGMLAVYQRARTLNHKAD